MSENFHGKFRKNLTPWNDTVRIADLAKAFSQSSLRGMWSRCLTCGLHFFLFGRFVVL